MPLDRAPFARLLVDPAEGPVDLFLADAPLGGLDELEDADGPALVPAAQREPEGGGRLALARAAVDDDERAVAALARRQSVLRGDGVCPWAIRQRSYGVRCGR